MKGESGKAKTDLFPGILSPIPGREIKIGTTFCACAFLYYICRVKSSLTLRRCVASLASVVLLAPGWLGLSGITLFAGFVPLLWISASYDGSRRSWWSVFGWALLVFAGWNLATVWWIWYATPVGPVAATLASSFLNMVAFMLFHTVSKKAPKALAYTLFVAGWIATEYWYTVGSFSWPWLILGNGFSHDVRLVQWYEYTGVFGGSLWVLVANLLIFEAWMHGSARRWTLAALAVAGPMILSGIIYLNYEQPAERCTITALQPNVDCYDKFAGDDAAQERNLLELMTEAPADVRFILAPETALTRYMDEAALDRYPHLQPFADTLDARYPDALFISGANTLRFYAPGARTETARFNGRVWYDHFNTAIALSGDGVQGLYHKGRLVIGVENTPTWVFRALKFLVIDLGGVLGQIGIGQNRTVFEAGGVRIGPAICYEGLYGDFYGDFVRRGAEVMAIISNDGWWGDTPGYRHLFSISRLRAVEHRRAVARCANTGRSGFIDCRGDVIGPSLGWDVRGAVTCELPLNREQTFYTRWGDYLGRLAQYVMGLCLLYYIAWRVKRKNYLVE